MNKLNLIIIVIFFGCLITGSQGCEERFIPDPLDPRLPKYTEDGNMVAGALINDVAWKTDWRVDIEYRNRSFYFTSYPAGDSISLTIDGSYIEGPDKNTDVSFVFVIKKMRLRNTDDLVNLKFRTFKFDGNYVYAVMNDINRPAPGVINYFYSGNGELKFQNVVPGKGITWTRDNGEEYHPQIVTGTFYMNFNKDSIKVKSGRFDFAINDAYIDSE
jgi:hypothetical protein